MKIYRDEENMIEFFQDIVQCWVLEHGYQPTVSTRDGEFLF